MTTYTDTFDATFTTEDEATNSILYRFVFECAAYFAALGLAATAVVTSLNSPGAAIHLLQSFNLVLGG